MNINYLLLMSDRDANFASAKKWYINKKHTEFFLPELKLSFFSFCLAERLRKPYYDYKLYKGWDPHRGCKKETPAEYMKATIHTNLAPEEVRSKLDFCQDCYEVQHYELKLSLAEIFAFKIRWLHSLSQVYSRVMFLDLDTVVRKPLSELVDPQKIYFYSDEGFKAVEHWRPTQAFRDLCKQADLSLEINAWNTGFVSAPAQAFQSVDVELQMQIFAGFVETGMPEPIAEQATITLVLVNYAMKNDLEVEQCLEHIDHYWYHGARKYRDMWDL